MKTYTIIGGVNGVGKSSLTGVLRAGMTDLGCIVDVDKLNALHGGDHIAGGKAAIAKIESCLERGICFTQETTLAGRRTAVTAKRARELGYRIRLYYVGLDTTQESLKRIQNRVEKGGHDIPPVDVERRFQSRFEDLARILPHCDEAVFFDNENGFVEVAEYKNGELLSKRKEPPGWIVALQNYLDSI